MNGFLAVHIGGVLLQAAQRGNEGLREEGQQGEGEEENGQGAPIALAWDAPGGAEVLQQEADQVVADKEGQQEAAGAHVDAPRDVVEQDSCPKMKSTWSGVPFCSEVSQTTTRLEAPKPVT